MSRRKNQDYRQNFDRYELHLAWLLGAMTAKRPGFYQTPLNPVLRAEFDGGNWAYRHGYVCLAEDCDPWAFIAHLKREHGYRHAAKGV